MSRVHLCFSAREDLLYCLRFEFSKRVLHVIDPQAETGISLFPTISFRGGWDEFKQNTIEIEAGHDVA